MIKQGDFIELDFTAWANGQIFDSNIPEDLKKIDPSATPRKTIIIVGQGMVLKGLDMALEGKEVGKQYTVKVSMEDGFGERKKDMIKTIPLHIFTKKNISPQPGAAYILDDVVTKIVAVSGARVTADFNSPLAGKDLEYKIIIKRIVTNDKEKSEAFFEKFFRFIPDFEVSEKITVKGPKALEPFVGAFKEKFKSLVGKELSFALKEDAPEEDKIQQQSL